MKFKDYILPKSMVYTGEHQAAPTTIKHWHYDAKTIKITDSFKPQAGLKHYIQVIGLSDIKTITALAEQYPIDPLILSDIFNVKQRNKIEIKDTYLFGAFHIEYLVGELIVEDYLSVLVFADTVISFHETKPVYLAPLTDHFENNPDLRNKQPDYLFFQLLDIITDTHLKVYERLEVDATTFEAEILETSVINQEQFYLLRKQLLKLKNNVTPTLEHIDKTINKRPPFFSDDNQRFFEDLKDHLVRLDNHLNQARELMRHLLDLQINNQSNKMNRIMTTLTLFSAIFIPLSFLTGFFGMNFVYFELLAYEHALTLFIGLCFLLAGFMFFLFKHLKWF